MAATSRWVGTASAVFALLLMTADGLQTQTAREVSLDASRIDQSLLVLNHPAWTAGPDDLSETSNQNQAKFRVASAGDHGTAVKLSPRGPEAGPGTPESTATSGTNGGTTRAIDNPPLRLAIIYGNLDIVEALLANGSDVNAISRAGAYPGETPLHSVAYAGHTRIAELLLDYGANVNATDRYRYTPLRRTVEQGHLPMTELLINKGADIVTTDSNGLNLLHVVARTDHVEIARLLITGGIDVNAMDNSGYTPLDYAQGGGIQMAETLQRHGAICTIC